MTSAGPGLPGFPATASSLKLSVKYTPSLEAIFISSSESYAFPTAITNTCVPSAFNFAAVIKGKKEYELKEFFFVKNTPKMKN